LTATLFGSAGEPFIDRYGPRKPSKLP